ncbi:LPXTG cell wall anchor domain-containing protein [Candidatus Enterococcus mansonii]
MSKKNNELLKWLVICLLCSIFLSGYLLFPLEINAQEGGAVETKGIINFYSEETPPTSSSEEKPPTSSSQEVPKVEKPKGRYPSTGEMVKTSLMISGLLLILFAVLTKRLKKSDSKGVSDNEG